MISKKELVMEITDLMKQQGFKVNPHLRPKSTSKSTLKKLHQMRRLEQLTVYRKSLLEKAEIAKEFGIDGADINPADIKLELVEVLPGTKEADLFFWWNLCWWSLPYEKPIGRQMRFILWDKTHDAPFGLLGLQSPPLRCGIRDNYIGVTNENVDYWINMSLYGQRIGALPPYNEILGGKMVTLALTSNEIRKAYREKYSGTKTRLQHRKIPSDLLFTTTTSAFGKSSMYDRVKYYDQDVSIFLGFTTGTGTFHISEEIFTKLLKVLERKGVDTKRGYGTGPSRKLKLIDQAFTALGIPQYTTHNVKRGFYLFPNVTNLQNVIQKEQKPKWYNRKLSDMNEFWKQRWALPRTERDDSYKNFEFDRFLKSTIRMLK